MFGSVPGSFFRFLRDSEVRGWFVDVIRGSRSRAQGLWKGPSGSGRELAVRGWLLGELEACLKVAEESFGARTFLDGSWKSSWLGSDTGLSRVERSFGARTRGNDSGRSSAARKRADGVGSTLEEG
jgi:hypothetical protein